MQPQTALLAEMGQTQDGLRTLAEQTGGIAVLDTNSFASSFDRIVQANSLYYMLGYYPPNHPQDGRFHKIEVRVKRPGLRVLARRGYASPRARDFCNRERQRVERERIARTKGADQTSSELRAMLDSPIQQSGLMLQVHAAPFKNTARNASVALSIEIDAARMQFAPPKGNGLRANTRVELPPGRYQLRIGVRESGAGETGTVFYDLDVPDFTRQRLSMSGLLLSAPSAQQTFTVQPDPVAAKVLPGAATSA